MTIYGDVDEEIRQRFAMLHLAWDGAYGDRKRNPTIELRKYLHILAGVNAIWQGIGKSKHYYRVSPIYKLDSGLTVGICRCICDILINTHPKYEIPDSLAAELAEVAGQHHMLFSKHQKLLVFVILAVASCINALMMLKALSLIGYQFMPTKPSQLLIITRAQAY